MDICTFSTAKLFLFLEITFKGREGFRVSNLSLSSNLTLVESFAKVSFDLRATTMAFAASDHHDDDVLVVTDASGVASSRLGRAEGVARTDEELGEWTPWRHLGSNAECWVGADI